jgi:lysophospholipase L1-like esterase
MAVFPAAGQTTAPATQPAVQVARETWDWSSAMLPVARKFKGTEGVVLFLGDSLTYANQATAWGRNVQGNAAGEYTDSDKAILKWSHAYDGQKDTNGWYLAAVDRPDGRSETAASGITTSAYIKGGFHGLPPLEEIIKKYNPQVAVVLLGTNDAWQSRPPADALKDMAAILDALLANGTIPVLMTLPPAKGFNPRVQALNEKYLTLAAEKKVPIIDLYGQMLSRRPGTTWQGTLVGGDGVHLTYQKANGPPTEENLKNCGYLLRCWLAVQKLKEIKKEVVDKR